MTSRRVAVASAALLAATGFALAGSPAAARPAPAQTSTSGHAIYLVYVTTNGFIRAVTVSASGTVGKPVRIGPAGSTPKDKRPFFAAASPDGKYVAWTQGGPGESQLLEIRNMTVGSTRQITTDKDIAGFAGDELITSFNRTYRLKPGSSHFTVVRNTGNSVITGYPGGVVDARYSQNQKDGILRLTGFGGRITRLHRYTDTGGHTYRDLDAGFVSSDGKHLVIERGNHQDFAGLGPRSLVDEYALSGGHHRSPLGSFNDSRTWRLEAAAFKGGDDQVWAAWAAQNKKSISTVIADYGHGRWHSRARGAITVAADRAGDVVIQPGRWTAGGGPSGLPQERTTRDAVLTTPHGNVTLTGVRGTAFFFVAGIGDDHH